MRSLFHVTNPAWMTWKFLEPNWDTKLKNEQIDFSHLLHVKAQEKC